MKAFPILVALVLMGFGCNVLLDIESGTLVENTASHIWSSWPMPNPRNAGLHNPAHYTVDATNSIVTDEVTKLIWQRNVDETPSTWENAKASCSNLVLGGYDDWRLPTRIELVSLVDFTTSSPAIDTTAFPNTPNVEFWSSSRVADSPHHAWGVMGDGQTSLLVMEEEGWVRCVR